MKQRRRRTCLGSPRTGTRDALEARRIDSTGFENLMWVLTPKNVLKCVNGQMVSL